MKILSLLVLIAVLAGCAPTVATRGTMVDADKLVEIRVGSSTREDVVTKLGTPTQVGTFDDKVWYYVGRETKQYSFFDPEVVKQKAVEIRFDDAGMVAAVNDLNPAAARDVNPVDRETPTYGRDDTFIQQLLGNLSRPRPKMNNPNGR